MRLNLELVVVGGILLGGEGVNGQSSSRTVVDGSLITSSPVNPSQTASQDVITLPLFVVEPGPPIMGSLVTKNDQTTVYQIWDQYPVTTGMFDGDGRHALGHGSVGPFTITYLPTGVNYEMTNTGQAITRGQCTTNGAYHACSYSTITTWNGCSIMTYRGHDHGNGKFFMDFLKVTMESNGPPNKGVINTASNNGNYCGALGIGGGGGGGGESESSDLAGGDIFASETVSGSVYGSVFVSSVSASVTSSVDGSEATATARGGAGSGEVGSGVVTGFAVGVGSSSSSSGINGSGGNFTTAASTTVATDDAMLLIPQLFLISFGCILSALVF